jgi:6-phosphogluconolactonase
MKFWNLGRVALALAASLVLIGGMDSCIYDYTNAYIIVTGSQYNQIASYREDNDTGQLRAAPGDPLSSGGQNPIRAVLLTGGRYVYVLNQGKPTVNSNGTLTWTGGNISVFSIGGDGQLAYQLSYPSQGTGSVRLAMSASGGFLYVLDEYEPTAGSPGVTAGSPSSSSATPCYDSTTGTYRPVGDVTVFSIDNSTGRLYLVQNQEQQTSSGVDLTYFPLGCNPIDMYQGSGFLYVAEVSHPPYPGTGEDIYPYQASSTGQLLPPQAPQFIPGTQGISVINGSASGKYIYVLDAVTNTIYPYTAGANGFLSLISGGSYSNEGLPNVDVGMDALTTDATSTYLYIANTQSPALGQANSAVSAYEITNGTGDLTPLSGGSGNLFATGSDPVCIFEDTSHQYVYTADGASSQITGAALNPQTGIITNLAHRSTFPTVGTPTWCLYSANTD